MAAIRRERRWLDECADGQPYAGCDRRATAGLACFPDGRGRSADMYIGIGTLIIIIILLIILL